VNPKQDHHVKSNSQKMKEEKGKILLLPSFIQQQQINKTNNKINKQHDKQA
jgi:hypothetical protein